MHFMHNLADLLLFLLPFERIPSFEVASVTVRFSSLVILLFAVTLLPWLILRRQIRPISSLDCALLLYVGAVFLSLPFALHLERSLLVAGLVAFVAIGYLLISRAYRSHFSFDRISKVIITTALVTACFGIFQYFGDVMGLPQSVTGLLDRYTSQVFGFPRIQSVGLEPLYYANYLLLPLFIVLARLITRPWNWIDAGTWLLLLWVFILSLSRGAYLGFAVGLIILMIALAYKKAIDWRKIGQTAGLTCVALLLAYVSVRVVSGPQGIQSFGSHAIVSQGAQEESSASPRIERFKEAIMLFKQHPATGVGVGGFGLASRFPTQPGGGYEIVNNQYLETLAETGIIGFVTLFGVAGVVLISLIRAIKKAVDPVIPIIFLSTFFSIATQYNFFSTIYILHIWALFGLIDSYLATKETE